VVFLSTIDSVEFHYAVFSQLFRTDPEQIEKKSFEVGKTLFKLHGNLQQVERTEVYFGFCQAKSALLFSTDVAARGLDLPNVNWIVQYDPPTQTREYVHRVGRTARIGDTGWSMLFLLPTELKFLELLKTHSLALSETSLDSILTHIKVERITKKKKSHKNKAPDVTDLASDIQNSIERLVLEDADLHKLSIDGFRSSVRAYLTHSHKDIFEASNLHLGHLAKSFALRDPPTHLPGVGLKAKKELTKNSKKRLEGKKRIHQPINPYSEFSSGF